MTPLSPPAAQGTVAGWKLVPVEPTEQMMDAAIATVEKPCFPQDIYAAMVAAAPASPSPEALPASGVDVDPKALQAARKVYNESLNIEVGALGATERIIRAYLAALTSAPAPEDR